jgi:hypothetical protein
MDLFKILKVYDYPRFEPRIRKAIDFFKEDEHRGSLVQIDIRDFEGCESDDSDWAKNALILKEYFTSLGENKKVHIHYRW